MTRLREPPVVVDDPGVASLMLHDPAELLERAAGTNRLVVQRAPACDVSRRAAEHEAPGRKLAAERDQVLRPFPLEHLESLDHLERVAGKLSERLAHVGDQRHDLGPALPADVDHGAGQALGIFGPFHEGAASGLDVEHQASDPLRQLLAHDARHDQGDAVDRRRDVPQRVELAVGRDQVRGLPRERHADRREHFPQALQTESDVETRDRLQLVERPAGVGESAARDHRNHHAGRSHRGRQHERGLVADAAGRVLVDLAPGERPKVQHSPGAPHRLRQGGGLALVQPAEHDRHQPRRDLVVRDFTRGVPAHEEGDLFVRQLRALSFLPDQVHGAHRGPLKRQKAVDLAARRAAGAESGATDSFSRANIPALPGAQVAHLLAQALAGEGLLDALLFAGLHVEGVFLRILDDVFLLHLPLEAPQRALERFTLVENHLGQSRHLPFGGA